MVDLTAWQPKFAAFVVEQMATDPGHDLAHIERVVQNAYRFAAEEKAKLEIVVPAAWLHDCVSVPKDSPQRPYASRMAAETAVAFLQKAGYPQNDLDAIAHAIAAHSFSANIPTKTVEAMVVQDADRIDAIGAIGIARCFAVGGLLQRPLYNPVDPFCENRPPDDFKASVDHFYTKLFTLVDTMKTEAGRQEAERRTQFMKTFLDQLCSEINVETTKDE